MLRHKKLFICIILLQILVIGVNSDENEEETSLYESQINGVNYGSKAHECYSKCEKGDICKIHDSAAVCKPYCGDGILNKKQKTAGKCDDKNKHSGDGCSSCTVDRLYVCTGSPSVCENKCGNGIFDASTGQFCDDGNKNNTDGCSNDCRINKGWECASDHKTCKPICGDGILAGSQYDKGNCDDGNKNSGDGCSSACLVEWSHTCCGAPSICTKKCGNGIWDQNANEQCDNSPIKLTASSSSSGQSGSQSGSNKDTEQKDDENEGDSSKNDQSSGSSSGTSSASTPLLDVGLITGCTTSCQIDFRWTCQNRNGYPSLCKPKCGDGKVVGSQKQTCNCDDGNKDQTDGCLSNCTVPKGWKCEGEPSKCQPICGDGIRVGYELGQQFCDDGNKDPNDGCNQKCRVTQKYHCTGQPSSCEKPCGNGKKQINYNQECDDGNTKSDDGCSSTCKEQKDHYTCEEGQGDLSECKPRCDDNEKHGEQSQDDEYCAPVGVGCTNCKVDPGFQCSEKNHPGRHQCKAICSDGIRKGQELTDKDYCYTDDNAVGAQGCVNCKTHQDWICTPKATNPERYQCVLDCQQGKRTNSELTDPDYCWQEVKTAGCVKCKIQKGYKCDEKTPESNVFKCHIDCTDGLRLGPEKDKADYCYTEPSSEGCKQCTEQTGWDCTIDPEKSSGDKQIFNCKPDCNDGKKLTGFEDYAGYCYVSPSNQISEPGCDMSQCKAKDGWICKPKSQGSQQYHCQPDCYDGIKLPQQNVNGDYCYVGKVDTPGCIKCKKNENFECEQKPDQVKDHEEYVCKRKCKKATNTDSIRDDQYCYVGDFDTQACIECKIQQGWTCELQENGLSICKPDCRHPSRVGQQKTDPKYCYSGEADTLACKECKEVQPWDCQQVQDSQIWECKKKCLSLPDDGKGGNLVKFDQNYCDSGNKNTNSCIGCKVQQGYNCKPGQNDGPTPLCTTQCDAIDTIDEKNDQNYCRVTDPTKGPRGCVRCKIVDGWQCTDTNNDQVKDSCKPKCRDGVKIDVQAEDESYCFVSSDPTKDTNGCKQCKQQPGYDCKVNENGKTYTCTSICTDGSQTIDEKNDPNYCFVSPAGDNKCKDCKVQDYYECKPKADQDLQSNKVVYECKSKCGDKHATPEQKADTKYCQEGKETDACKSCQVQDGYKCKFKTDDPQISQCHVDCDDGRRLHEELDDTDYCFPNDGVSCINCKKQEGFQCTENSGVYSCHLNCADGKRLGPEKDKTDYCYTESSSDGCKQCKEQDGWDCKIDPAKSSGEKEIYNCKPDCQDGKKISAEDYAGYCYVSSGNQLSQPGCDMTQCKAKDGWICKPTSTNIEQQYHCTPDCRNPSRVGDQVTREDYCYTEKPNNHQCNYQTCKTNPYYKCVPKQGQNQYDCSSICQDNHITEQENADTKFCHEEPTKTTDGCKNCKIQDFWQCSRYSTQNGDIFYKCQPICGDGAAYQHEVDEGNCDLKITHENRGQKQKICKACKVQPGWQCKNQVGKQSVCKPKCGDGKFVSNQASDPTYCDDGNTSDGDGCSSTCKVQYKYHCDINPNPQQPISKCSKYDECIQKEDGTFYCFYDCGKSNYGKNKKVCQIQGGYCNDFNSIKNDGCTQCKVDKDWVVENVVVLHKDKPDELQGFRMSFLTKCGNQKMDFDQSCDYSVDNHVCPKRCNYVQPTCGNNQIQDSQVCDYFWGCQNSCGQFQNGWTVHSVPIAPLKGFKVSNSRNVHKTSNDIIETLIIGYYPQVELKGGFDLHKLGWGGLKAFFNYNNAYFSPGNDYDKYNALKLAVELVGARLNSLNANTIEFIYSGDLQKQYLQDIIKPILQSKLTIQLTQHSENSD